MTHVLKYLIVNCKRACRSLIKLLSIYVTSPPIYAIKKAKINAKLQFSVFFTACRGDYTVA